MIFISCVFDTCHLCTLHTCWSLFSFEGLDCRKYLLFISVHFIFYYDQLQQYFVQVTKFLFSVIAAFRKYKVPMSAIIPFPKRNDPSGALDFPTGKHVLAVYPGTTALYKATVVNGHRKVTIPSTCLLLVSTLMQYFHKFGE